MNFYNQDTLTMERLKLVLILLVPSVMSHIMRMGSEEMNASLHFSRLIKDGRCKLPFKKLVYLSDLYPSEKKKFVPHATILHFCGSETGCCNSESQVCAPKTQQNVTLVFWVIELTNFGQKKGVEKLIFRNDTECECQPINQGAR